MLKEEKEVKEKKKDMKGEMEEILLKGGKEFIRLVS